MNIQSTIFQGLIFIKHGRLGTRSEGPDYFLQTWKRDFLLVYDEKRHPWLPDYYLEFFNRKIVEVTGIIAGKRDDFEMIFADHEIDDHERFLIEKYAIGLGYTAEIAQDLIKRSIAIYSGGLSLEDYRYLLNRKE